MPSFHPKVNRERIKGAVCAEQAERPLQWHWVAAVPVILAPLAMSFFSVVEVKGTYESPGLLLGLNVVFSLLSAIAAFLIGRSFLRQPSLAVLFLGSGALAWGAAGMGGMSAGIGHSGLKHFDINLAITVHNLGVMLSGLLHLAGALASERGTGFGRRQGIWVASAYGLTVGLIALFALGAMKGLTPLFFVQGQGGTLAREVVLGLTVGILFLTAVMLGVRKSKPLPDFVWWYVGALLLFGTGLMGVWLVKVSGCVLSWIGRVAQYAGSCYLAAGAFNLGHHTRSKDSSLDLAIEHGEYRYQLAVVMIASSIAVRLAFLQSLGNNAPFISFYPAVMISALYGGTRAGLLATFLSAVSAEFFWIEPRDHWAVFEAKDGLLLGLFVGSCSMISWVSGAVQRARTRALRAELRARHLEVVAKTQSDLRGAHEELREVFGSITDGLVLLDRDWRYTFVNEQATRILGLPREGVLGGCMWELFPYLLNTPFEEGFRSAMQSSRAVHFEGLRPGRVQWLECHCYPSEKKLSIYFRDITERKLADMALRASENRYRSLFENNLDPIFSINAQGRFLSANPAAEALSGYSSKELQAKTIAQLCVPEYREPTMASFQASLHSQQPGIETAMERKDGRQVDLFVTGVPVRLGKNTTLFCIARDITARKREERARSLTMELLSLANASTSTEEFVRATIAFFRKLSGCDAVGIRLREEGDYPCYDSIGFDPGYFGEDDGRVAKRTPEEFSRCFYGMVLGEHGALKDLLTDNGTFWSADLPGMLEKLLARGLMVSEEPCFSNGFQSLAIIPLGNRGHRLGLLKLCSKKEGHFSAEDIELFEQLADKLSLAIGRFQIEETRAKALRVLEEQVAKRTEELKRANRALLTLKDCDEVLARAEKEPELLEKICRLIARMEGVRLVWVGIAEQNEAKTVQLVAYAGVDDGGFLENSRSWAESADGGGPAARAIRTREVYLCRDIADEECCETLHSEQLARGFAAFISLPLKRGDQCLGALTIHSDRVNAFNEQEIDLLTRLADELAHGMITLRTRADQDRLKEELFWISEREKQAIARELHDGLCQHLSGTAILASLLHRKLEEGGSSEAGEAQQIQALLKTAVEEARNLSHGLHPVPAEPEGLMAALAGLARMVRQLFHVDCSFQCDKPVFIQNQAIATHLFRMAQEATNNAIKHGNAAEVRIALRLRGGRTVLSIQDNGVGFPSNVNGSKGMGLQILRYRAAEIGASLEIRRIEPEGTLVECVFPAP